MRQFITCFAIALCSSFAFAAPRALAREWACATASPLTAGTVTYVDGLDAGATALFAVDVPAPGRLAVEIAVPGREENLPWIEILPVPCDASGAIPGRFLERDFSRQVLDVTTPGTYAARVGAVDPGRGLEGYALSVQLRPASRLASKTGGSGSDDDTDDSNNEIVPIIFDGPVDAEPVCKGGLMLCARELELGVVAEGELAGGWAGDYYSFTLDHARTVRVGTEGEADTLGVLYDAAGHRLLVADDGGTGESFSFRVWLPAGRYVLRVEEAMGAAGAYRLISSDSDL